MNTQRNFDLNFYILLAKNRGILPMDYKEYFENNKNTIIQIVKYPVTVDNIQELISKYEDFLEPESKEHIFTRKYIYGDVISNFTTLLPHSILFFRMMVLDLVNALSRFNQITAEQYDELLQKSEELINNYATSSNNT